MSLIWCQKVKANQSPRSQSNRSAVHEYVPGYGKAAAIMETDPSFLIFRKFGWLRNSVLLDLQDELQSLESNLIKHSNLEEDDTLLKSRKSNYESMNSREELIVKIKEKLKEYGKQAFF